jgi:hypothetical protein
MSDVEGLGSLLIDAVGDAARSPRPSAVAGSGEGELAGRELDATMVVACRFAGLAVDIDTCSIRVLNMLRFISSAAVASS